MIFFGGHINAQLSVNQQNAQALVQNVLVGAGVTVSNISFTGDPVMLGSFNGINSNIGLKNGIIMSTGNIYDAVGPNNSPSSGEDLKKAGYTPLQNLLGPDATTQDAAILKFDFYCERDIVQFKYVFASEEYPEYVGTKYNDVFAFFIQGPGIPGIKNIARIPGSNNIPVAINNVNQNSFQSFFRNNGNGILGGGPSVQFDGFTTPFIAEATVIPCQKYTIILAISDVSDGLYDSGVFLEAQSFVSPEIQIQQKLSYVNASGKLYENCGSNKIILKRTGPTNKKMTIFLESGGTATYGQDYTAFPRAVTFEPGQDSVSFDIFAFPDSFNETVGESVSIVFRDTGCTKIEIKKLDFTIFDPPPGLTVDAGKDVELICPRTPVLLNASITGGIPPYVTKWNTGKTGNPVTEYPDSSSIYTIEAKDQCGAIASDTIKINIKNYSPIKLNISKEFTICAGEKITIGGNASGGKKPLLYSWKESDSKSPFLELSPIRNESYSLTVTDSCGISVTQTIHINVKKVEALFDIKYIDSKTIQFKDKSYSSIKSRLWNFGDGSEESLEKDPLHAYADTGLYMVRLIVSDSSGCIDTLVKPVRSYPPLHFYIPNSFTPDGDGLNDFFSGVGEGFISYELLIFNRWGEIIFQSDDYKNKWGFDNRAGMNNIPLGIYVYKLTLKTPMLDRREYIGKVSAIR